MPFMQENPEKVEVGAVKRIGQDNARAPSLTTEEKNKIMDIIKGDPQLKGILSGSAWQVLHISPWSDGTEQKGGVALIQFDKAVWAEGEFKVPGAQPYRASLWAGNMHVFVDLKSNTIAGKTPGVVMPSGQVPADKEPTEAKATAKARAIEELKNNNIEAKLLAVYNNAEYPRGLALFLITSEQGDEMTVGVDLDQNKAVEKFTARTVK